MKKFCLFLSSIFLVLSFAFSATATPISDPLPENTYITWNNLNWTWASAVSKEDWYGANTLSAPSSHEGWRFATEEELIPFLALDGGYRVSLFDDGDINSTQYWNTVTLHVDDGDMSAGYVVSEFNAATPTYDMVYVRDITAPVPEPATILLFGLGLLGLAGVNRRKTA